LSSVRLLFELSPIKHRDNKTELHGEVEWGYFFPMEVTDGRYIDFEGSVFSNWGNRKETLLDDEWRLSQDIQKGHCHNSSISSNCLLQCGQREDNRRPMEKVAWFIWEKYGIEQSLPDEESIQSQYEGGCFNNGALKWVQHNYQLACLC